MCCGSQEAKTDGALNIIGQKMDDDPEPGIYVGPSKKFVTEQMEPRLMSMIDSADNLSKKLARGQNNKKASKLVSGVELKLAWAGSATELASFPAAWGIVDERDRMDANVKGEGDPVELLLARGDTYQDFTLGVLSTPLIGNVEVVWDETAKVFRWAVAEPEVIQSATWKLWQEGTRHEFAWPCPHCDEYFIPRFEMLKWPKGATPAEAKKQAYIECHHCGGVIEEKHKLKMNQLGQPIAPGQWVDSDREVQGDPPDTDTASLWTSGLCSPWKSFGDRASRFLKAVNSGDQTRIQAAINTGFGELFKIGGADALTWSEILEKREHYRFGEIPDGVQKITCSVDVQKDRLIYAIRGWGANWESWQLECGQLDGSTSLKDVWDDLWSLIVAGVNGRMIDLTLIDSGYRPGKPVTLPLNMIYEFCRKHKGRVRPTKGRATMDRPYKMSRIDVNNRGKVIKNGLELWHLDTDYFKSWVHVRLDIDEEDDKNGKFHISEDADDVYCRALVSETRTVKPSGQVVWVVLNRENHYLDCESMNVAAAHMLGVHRLREKTDTIDNGSSESVGSALAAMNQ